MRIWHALPLVVAVMTLAGCGSVSEQRAGVSAVALRLLTAVNANDGAAACVVLAPDTRAELEQTAGKPCAEAIVEEALPKPGTVRSSAVYGQWAQVVLSDDTLFLAAFPGGWRVVAAGCHPRGQRPYDCALQGG